MTKVGYLSLSFILSDQSYWLTTGCGRADWSFTVVPLSVFGDAVLKPNHGGSDMSEITVFEDQGKTAYIFSAITDVVSGYVDLKIETRTSLSWNDMIKVLLDSGAPLVELTDMFHHHRVRKVEGATIQCADVEYLVTAFLPRESDRIFAVFGSDYVAGTNPNWLTIHSGSDDEYRARLRDWRVVIINMGGKLYGV